MKRQMARRIGVKPLAVPEITAPAAESANPEEIVKVGTEEKPPGKTWRKANSTLNLVHGASAPSDMPSSDTALAQHRSQSFRCLPSVALDCQIRDGMLHKHSQSLRDVSQKERYRRLSNASTTSSTSTTTISPSSAPAEYDWSSEQNPRHRGISTDSDVPDQMHLEVEQLKRRDNWVARQHERLSRAEMHEKTDPGQDAPARPSLDLGPRSMQDLSTRSRDAVRPHSAKPVALKEQLRRQTSLKEQLRPHQEWKPLAEILPTLDADLARRKETRKVFKARKFRKARR